MKPVGFGDRKGKKASSLPSPQEIKASQLKTLGRPQEGKEGSLMTPEGEKRRPHRNLQRVLRIHLPALKKRSKGSKAKAQKVGQQLGWKSGESTCGLKGRTLAEG